MKMAGKELPSDEKTDKPLTETISLPANIVKKFRPAARDNCLNFEAVNAMAHRRECVLSSSGGLQAAHHFCGMLDLADETYAK